MHVLDVIKGQENLLEARVNCKRVAGSSGCRHTPQKDRIP